MTTTTESASYSQMHFGPNTTDSPSDSAANCSYVSHQSSSPIQTITTQDSDCGSSSGVGGSGTTKHEAASDVSSLDSESRDSGQETTSKKSEQASSSQQSSTVTGVPIIQTLTGPKMWNPNQLRPTAPFFTMTMGNTYDPSTSTTSSTIIRPGLLSAGPTTIQQQQQQQQQTNNQQSSNNSSTGPINSTINNTQNNLTNGNHEVFVHVSPGKKIILLGSTDKPQTIVGPATIRYAGAAVTSPHALPLNVPQGYLVQQILDEQGRLRHIILTSEQIPSPAGVRMQLTPQNQRTSGSTTPLKNIPNAIPSTSNGTSPKSVSPPVVPAYSPMMTPDMIDPNYFIHNSIRQPWVPNKHRQSTISTVPCGPNIEQQMFTPIYQPIVQQPCPTSGYPNPVNQQNHDDEYGFEEDERERLKDTLNSIQPPTIMKIYTKEVEVTWQTIDTSEAAASGGPFPQIDASEFIYEIFVYDGNNPTHMISRQKCDHSSNILKITRLIPNTNYMINMRASLPEKDLYGHTSQLVHFKTKSITPDIPNQPKINNRGPTWLVINWRNSIQQQGQIKRIIVQYAKNDKREPYINSIECTGEQTKITHLEPSTSYKIRIIARNDNGDSEPSMPVYGTTTSISNQQSNHHHHHHQGPSSSSTQQQNYHKLQPPYIVNCYNRSIKIVWTPFYHPNNYTLEYSESKTSGFIPIPQECYNNNGTGAIVNNLHSNREYWFRLRVLTDNGQEICSESIQARTRRDQYENSNYQMNNNNNNNNQIASSSSTTTVTNDRPLAPINLTKTFIDDNLLELTWRYPTREFDGLTYIVEGTNIEDEQTQLLETSWKICYKGSSNTCTINDSSLIYFRIQSINNKKRTFSQWSDIIKAKRIIQKIIPPPTCTTPKILNITWCSLDFEWKLTEEYKNTNPLIYELQRIDRHPMIVYSGELSQCKLDNLKPVEHVQVRARAVIVDYEGKRNEGIWSPIASACTLINVPSEPLNLKITMNNNNLPILTWDQPLELNGSDIIKYIINTTININDEIITEKYGETIKTEIELDKLIPNTEYIFTIIGVNKGGNSKTSNILEYKSLPTKPSIPTNLHVETLSSTELKLSWLESNDNGSKLLHYILEIYEYIDIKNINLIEQHYLSIDEKYFYIKNLKPETIYKLNLLSENEYGKSDISTIKCETLSLPPNPPELILVQSSYNLLKLKWIPSNLSSIEPTYYYIEKLNDNGNFVKIYEGNAKYTKVKNLKESTIHKFRIRATNAKGITSQIGEWSKIYEFMTTKMPPPSIKGLPNVVEISQCVFQIDWTPIRFINNNNNNNNDEENNNNDTIVYRLQIAPKPDRKGVQEQWKTVYEGTCHNFTLTVSPTSTITRICRVFVVQKNDTEELCSSPSLITSFATTRTPHDTPKKRAKNNNNSGSSTPSSMCDSPRSPSSLNKSNKLTYKKVSKKISSFIRKTISESNGALIIMLIFFLLAVIIAFILNNYYI